jgi:hypothetical protein
VLQRRRRKHRQGKNGAAVTVREGLRSRLMCILACPPVLATCVQLNVILLVLRRDLSYVGPVQVRKGVKNVLAALRCIRLTLCSPSV